MVFDFFFCTSSRKSIFLGMVILSLNTSALTVWADETSQPSEMTPETTEVAEELDIRVPRYQQIKPNVAVQVTVSPKAFDGPRTASSAASGVELRGASLQIEYQPEKFQKYGIWSVGGGLGLYRPVPSTATRSFVGTWSASALIRYQLRYFREQPIVPVLSYQLEHLRYSMNGRSGSFLAHGPAVGIWILLNVIDSDSAATFYAESKVCRSYLVAELRKTAGSDRNLRLEGNSYFFGLRFEL